MAVELKHFLDDLVQTRKEDDKDKIFLEAVKRLVDAYVRVEEQSQVGRLDPRQQIIATESERDLSKIPFDVDAADNDLLVNFIARLDIPYRVKSSVVRHSAIFQFRVDESMRLKTIRDLYNLDDRDLIIYLRQMGKKGEFALRKSLDRISETGEMPSIDDMDAFSVKHRLMSNFR